MPFYDDGLDAIFGSLEDVYYEDDYGFEEDYRDYELDGDYCQEDEDTLTNMGQVSLQTHFFIYCFNFISRCMLNKQLSIEFFICAFVPNFRAEEQILLTWNLSLMMQTHMGMKLPNYTATLSSPSCSLMLW